MEAGFDCYGRVYAQTAQAWVGYSNNWCSTLRSASYAGKSVVLTLLTLRSKLGNYSTTEGFIYIIGTVKIGRDKRRSKSTTGNRGRSTIREQ